MKEKGLGLGYFLQISNCLNIWLKWGKERLQKQCVSRNENMKTTKLKVSTGQKQMSPSLAMVIPTHHRHLIISEVGNDGVRNRDQITRKICCV